MGLAKSSVNSVATHHNNSEYVVSVVLKKTSSIKAIKKQMTGQFMKNLCNFAITIAQHNHIFSQHISRFKLAEHFTSVKLCGGRNMTRERTAVIGSACVQSDSRNQFNTFRTSVRRPIIERKKRGGHLKHFKFDSFHRKAPNPRVAK